MKKSISVFLAILMLLATLSVSTAAFAATGSGSCGSNVQWSLNSAGTITISKGSGSGEARMNDFVNNGASRPGWYDMRTDIKKIVIQSGVVNVSAYAFADCTSCTEVDFGEIDTLGNNAFMNCTALTYISLPSSFNWMYDNVFEGCTALKSAYLGERWWTEGTLPSGFFKNCTSLLAVKMGSKFTGFESGAFEGCSALQCIISDNENISLSGVKIVRTSTLSGTCSDNTYSSTNLTYSFDLQSLTMTFTGSGDMNSVPWENLKGAIETVTFANTDGKVTIDTSAFELCINLTSVDFKNVASIGWGAFGRCYKLGSVWFDSPLSEIWDYAFSECTSIDTVRFTESNTPLHIHHHAFNLCSGTTYWLDIPENTTKVDDHAFWGTNFNYVKVFNPDVQFGDDAFGNGKGGYARFFSLAGQRTTTYDYVLQNRKAYKSKRAYDWHYYCLTDDHVYGSETIAPTCTDQGYDRYGCIYCDTDELKSNYVPALGHIYECTGTDGGSFVYRCGRCGKNNFEYSAIEPLFNFEDAITHDNEPAFEHENYSGIVDVNHDGYINGRDLAHIKTNLAQIATTNRETTIDTSTTYQTIEGWGASGCWWSQDVGTWENCDEILRLLYSRSGGIGLNIYRYNLGAGSQDDNSLYNRGTRTYCFLNSDGTYNWDTDEGQRNALYWANRYCPDVKVELFSNSAPVSMTVNGKSYGSPVADGEDVPTNLDSSHYQDFTNFYITCAKHFIDEGYNVTELSPINEPEWGWTGWYNGDGSISSGQEGCHWVNEDARNFYNNYFVPSIRDDSVLGTNGRKTEIAVWECAQLNHSWMFEPFMNYFFNNETKKNIWGTVTGGWGKDNGNIRGYVDTLDTHSYWASTDDRYAVMNNFMSNNYFSGINHIKCSEYCQMYNDYSSGVIGHIQSEGGSTNGTTIDYGLAMADIIYQDMTILNATEWDWWTACAKGIYTDALVYVTDGTHEYETAKRLWCLGNYSKFIREGAKRIKVETGSAFGSNLHTDSENIYEWDDGYGNTGYDKNNYIEESAYLNPDGTVAVVYINNSDTIEYTSFASSDYANFKTYVTDENKNLELYQEGSTMEAVCIPARSCTTVVLDNDNDSNAKYLFAYFTGNSKKEQRIHFATSNGGNTFKTVNDGKEVITQTEGTLCCRDPYIFKGQDDYYYLIATDMDASGNVWWGNSNTMVIWRSKDLVNWTDETIIDMATLTNTWIGRCWAPQVIWDKDEQKYMVYLSLYTNGDDNGTVIYYSYTDDLLDQSHYSRPRLLFDPNTGKDAIDADITEFGGKYYMFFKDEDAKTICVTSADTLTGEYSTDFLVLDTLFNDGKSEGLEGCQVYKEADGDYIFIADRYGAAGTFAAFNLGNDLAASIELMKNGKSVMDYYDSALSAELSKLTPRHGSMISITDKEYDRLRTEF